MIAFIMLIIKNVQKAWTPELNQVISKEQNIYLKHQIPFKIKGILMLKECAV